MPIFDPLQPAQDGLGFVGRIYKHLADKVTLTPERSTDNVVRATSATAVPFVVKRFSSGAASDLLQIQDETGAVLGGFGSTGSPLGGSLPVNVTSYGATGDGSTDDTTAVLAALSAAGTHATLYFPAGTYKMALGAIGSAVANGGRSIRLIGAHPYRTLFQPLSNTVSIFTIQGSGDKADDFFEMQNIGVTSPSSRAYDVPCIDIRLVRGWRIHNCRADVDTLNSGTLFKISSAYEGGFSNTKLRTGKYVVPVEFVNDQALPSTPGVAPQIDTVDFSGLKIIGVCGVNVRNAPAGGVTGNEIHGLDFTRYKHVATTFYPAANSPLFETTLNGSTLAGATSFVVTSAGTPGSAQTGISVGDIVTIDSGDLVDYAQVTAIAGTTISCHALGPLVRAHASGAGVIVGGASIVLGSNIHAVTLGPGCHLEGNLVGVLADSVQGITGVGLYNGSGELIRVTGNVQKIRLTTLTTRGTSAKHTIIFRPSYASSSSDGDWEVAGLTIDAGAPIANPTLIPHTTRAWITRHTNAALPNKTTNIATGGGASEVETGQINGAKVYSRLHSGQVRATDGVQTKFASGAGKTTVVDGDFTVAPVDGTIAIHRDTTASKTYISVRSNGAWVVMAGPL